MEKRGISPYFRRLRSRAALLIARPFDGTPLSTPKKAYSWAELAVLYVAWIAMLVFVLSRAWVAEDAYITFRVIDNFFNGYGLRWNISERVQPYTHPLWMFLHMPLYLLSDNLYLDTIVLSVTCTMIAVALTIAATRRPAVVVLACLFLPLLVSKSFLDYTTSGLENPLSYLLFAAFGYLLVRHYHHPRFWFYCSLAVALAVLNRMDVAVLYLPVLAYLVFTRHREIRWGHIVLGAMPLIGWFAFSLFYYGFLFPNTKYAKLNTGLSQWLYLREGVRYLYFMFIKDTAGTLALLSPLLVVMRSKRFMLAQHPASVGLIRSIAAGIYAYIAYVIFIGGDYMAGRFWAFPVFVSIWLWFVSFPATLRLDLLFVIVCVLAGTAATPPLLESIRKSCSTCVPLKGKVMDARYTFSRNKLIAKYSPLQIRKQGQYNFAETGRKLARETDVFRKQFFVGMAGYYAGPQAHLIDELALADPLLARLPVPKAQKDHVWIGHFRRNLPRGYIDAIKTRKLAPMPPMLARYYEKLRLITSGDLGSTERLKTIVLFNLGYYDQWKNEYIANNPQ